MAKQVQAQVAGGKIEVHKNIRTVGDLREKLDLDNDHTASVNGEPADDEDRLDEFAFVSFAPKVVGG